MPTFDEKDRYGADTMPRDSKAVSGATMQIDPTQIKGLEGYQPGDTVDLKVKVRWGEAMPEGGPIDVEVLSVMAEPMEMGAQMRRKETKANRIPPPMDEGEGDY